jgi:hypothetical protein
MNLKPGNTSQKSLTDVCFHLWLVAVSWDYISQGGQVTGDNGGSEWAMEHGSSTLGYCQAPKTIHSNHSMRTNINQNFAPTRSWAAGKSWIWWSWWSQTNPTIGARILLPIIWQSQINSIVVTPSNILIPIWKSFNWCQKVDTYLHNKCLSWSFHKSHTLIQHWWMSSSWP